jgi:hypothetical protein
MFGRIKKMFAARPAAEADGSGYEVPAAARGSMFMPQSWEMLVQTMVNIPDPDLILRKRGEHRESLGKLLYDDEIFQCVQTREDGLQNTPVRLEPTESESSRFIAGRCLTPATKRTIVGGAFRARLFGWSIQEIIWDRNVYESEGAFVPRDISERSLRYFTVRPDGTLCQNVAAGGSATDRIHRDPALQRRLDDVPGSAGSWVAMNQKTKFLLTRDRPTWDNPYGEALLSRVYWAWFFRNNSWQYLAQYLERYAVGILVGTLPPDSSMSADQLADMLLKAQQNAVAVIKGGTITSVMPNASGTDLYKSTEEMLVRRIEKVILGQTLTSGTDGGSGNRALGEVHNEIRKDKTLSDISLVTPTVQTFVDACHHLNGFAGPPPEVIFGDEVSIAKDRADRDSVLIRSGIVESFSEAYLLDNYGFRPGEIRLPEIPPPGPREKLIEVERTQPGAERFSAARPGGRGRPSPAEFSLEALAVWAARKFGDPLLKGGISRALRESETAGELMGRLSEIQEEFGSPFAEAALQTDEACMARGMKDLRVRE